MTVAERDLCDNCKTEDATYWVDGVLTCGPCLVDVVDAHLMRVSPVEIQAAI